jgi:hypothetical protein
MGNVSSWRKAKSNANDLGYRARSASAALGYVISRSCVLQLINELQIFPSETYP